MGGVGARAPASPPLSLCRGRRWTVYQHILLAVALQRWDGFSPHAVAARQAAVALARGAGAPLTVLSVYDYNDETPGAVGASRIYTTRVMLRLDDPSETKLQQLVTQFGASKAEVIRQLIAQATTEDFPTAGGCGQPSAPCPPCGGVRRRASGRSRHDPSRGHEILLAPPGRPERPRVRAPVVYPRTVYADRNSLMGKDWFPSSSHGAYNGPTRP
jgi:hypothetical protein